VDDGLGDADALAKAVRKRADHVVADAAQRRRARHFVDAFARLGPADASDFRGEEQVFAHRHLVVERRMIGQVADPGAHVVGVVDHVETIDPHAARRRKKVAGEDAQRGRLARTVQAEQADNFALGDGERQRTDRLAIAVVLR
jgi:hypothetical protein